MVGLGTGRAAVVCTRLQRPHADCLQRPAGGCRTGDRAGYPHAHHTPGGKNPREGRLGPRFGAGNQAGTIDLYIEFTNEEVFTRASGQTGPALKGPTWPMGIGAFHDGSASCPPDARDPGGTPPPSILK